jgi:hypothetical protein
MVHMQKIEPTAAVPLPFDISDEQPKTHSDSLSVATNTIDFLKELGGDISYDDEDLHKAAELIQGADKPSTPKHLSSSTEAAAAHALIKRFDFSSFADALQARNFITNKLVSLADCGDPKLEIRALELLGKHSDIGLFTERSEVTIHHKTSVALENSIKERVKRLLNADITDIGPIDDLDAQLGVSPSHEMQIDTQEDTQEDTQNEYDQTQNNE